MHHASSSARFLGETNTYARVVQLVSPFLQLGKPYPRGEECGRVSWSAIEAVPEQDACCEHLGVEEEFSTSGEFAEESVSHFSLS
ncbi:hypothetical protein A2U01_0057741, partial [Trifolium medium]|nr:hypothetical protein [Trifolium medium]